MRPVEFYPNKQGRPFSPPVSYVSTGAITSTMLTDSAINAILSYIVTYEDIVISIGDDVVWHKE